MDDGEEGVQVLGIACSQAAPLFEMQKSVFDQVTQPVQLFVVMTWILAVPARRDLRFHALLRGLLDNGIAVIALVRDQMFGFQPLDQAASF